MNQEDVALLRGPKNASMTTMCKCAMPIISLRDGTKDQEVETLATGVAKVVTSLRNAPNLTKDKQLEVREEAVSTVEKTVTFHETVLKKDVKRGAT